MKGETATFSLFFSCNVRLAGKLDLLQRDYALETLWIDGTVEPE
jgi:hypothetical protein